MSFTVILSVCTAKGTICQIDLGIGIARLLVSILHTYSRAEKLHLVLRIAIKERAIPISNPVI